MIQKVVNWGMTTVNEIRVESVNSPQIDWKGSVMQEIRSVSFTCEMVFDNVSFTSLPLCLGNLSGVFIQNGYGQDGVVSVTLDEFAAQACSVPIKCKGCSLTCASIIIAEKSQSGRAHVVCGNGTGHVELGTTAIPIECLITPVSQAWRLVSHAVGRYTSNGLAGVGGVWEDLSGNFKFSWGWFSGGWILPIVVVLLSVLMLGKSATLVVIVLVFAFYVRFVAGDVGCGIDTTRRTISCGSGAFVWKHLGSGPDRDHSVELDDYGFTDLYIKDMFDGTNKPCLVCEDALQCAALRRAAVAARMAMHPARVYINDTLSYTRQFIETRKRTLTVTLDSLEYKIGSYITHGRLEGDMDLRIVAGHPPNVWEGHLFPVQIRWIQARPVRLKRAGHDLEARVPPLPHVSRGRGGKK